MTHLPRIYRESEQSEDVRKMFQKIRMDYSADYDMMSDEEEGMARLKRVVDGLPLAEKTIIILYAELASTRKVAEVLGNVSHTTVANELIRIRAKVREQLK